MVRTLLSGLEKALQRARNAAPCAACLWGLPCTWHVADTTAPRMETEAAANARLEHLENCVEVSKPHVDHTSTASRYSW